MTLTARRPPIQPSAKAGPRSRRPQDEDDGDDRDRTEGDGDRRRQQVTDNVDQQARPVSQRTRTPTEAADPDPR